MIILVIGAHRDDCEIGAGGLIAKAVRKEHQVILVTVCAGGIDDWCVSKGREKEYREWTIRKAKEMMSVEKILLPYGDKNVITDMETRKEVYKKLSEIILEIRPDITLFHNRFETMPADHGIVGELAEYAVVFGGYYESEIN